MTNEITIDPYELLMVENGSITDPETIRQIALYTNKYGNNALVDKIKPGFEVCGMYPNVIKSYNIVPDKV